MNNYKRIVKATLFVFLMFVLVTIVSCDMEALNKTGFSVTYDKNDADDGTVPGIQYPNERGSIEISGNTGNLTKKGFIFYGWSTNKTNSSFLNKGDFITADRPITLYAQFEKPLTNEIVNATKLENGSFKITNEGYTVIAKNAFSGKKEELKSVEIPSTIRIIDKKAFSDCSNLSSVTLPDGLMAISREAFTNCTELKAITIPKSVHQIFGSAFKGCKNLEISIDSQNLNLTTDGISIYSNRGKRLVCCPSASGTYTVSENVEEIFDQVFEDNLELTKIVFPKNLKKIWYGVFTDCKNLKEIEFAGTKEQWESITKISNWNYNCNSIKVTCKADNNTFDIPPYKY